MRFFLTLFLSAIFITGFSQNSIQEIGDWCEGNLNLKLNLNPGTTLTAWEKDGILLVGETSNELVCSNYGAGVYKAVLNDGTSVIAVNHELKIAGPFAQFKATNYPAAAVTFFADQSISSESIVSWSWDFGNGETSTEKNPRVMFKENKEYTIRLTVTTAAGCSHTITQIHNGSYN